MKKCVNPHPPLPGCTSSKSSSSPYFSSSTSKNEDAVQTTHTRHSAPMPMWWMHMHTFTRPPKGNSVIQHTSVESPVCLAFCCCSLRISLVCWLCRHQYYQEYFYLFDSGPSPRSDMIEVKMFAFLALTLEMAQTGGVLDEVEQLRCPFCGQTMVHLRYYHRPRFLHFIDSGRNVVDRMYESRDRLWTI